MNLEQFRATFGELVQNVTWVLDAGISAAALRECARPPSLIPGVAPGRHRRTATRIDPGVSRSRRRGRGRRHVATDHTGLSNLEEAHDNVVEMAEAYRQQFGFPLVICARETERCERVLRNGWTRMDNAPGSEKAFALTEVAKIANYRFDDLVADANPVVSAWFNRFPDVMG